MPLVPVVGLQAPLERSLGGLSKALEAGRTDGWSALDAHVDALLGRWAIARALLAQLLVQEAWRLASQQAGADQPDLGALRADLDQRLLEAVEPDVDVVSRVSTERLGALGAALMVPLAPEEDPEVALEAVDHIFELLGPGTSWPAEGGLLVGRLLEAGRGAEVQATMAFLAWARARTEGQAEVVTKADLQGVRATFTRALASNEAPHELSPAAWTVVRDSLGLLGAFLEAGGGMMRRAPSGALPSKRLRSFLGAGRRLPAMGTRLPALPGRPGGWALELVGAGPDPFGVISAVAGGLGCGLGRAKLLVEQAPVVLLPAADSTAATALRDRLSELGAEVDLRPA